MELNVFELDLERKVCVCVRPQGRKDYSENLFLIHHYNGTNF